MEATDFADDAEGEESCFAARERRATDFADDAEGEEIVVWWRNSEIRDLGFSFVQDKTYTIRFKGALETEIMGYKGKGLRATQILTLEERERPPTTATDPIRPVLLWSDASQVARDL
jgi:hypothetical protein